jgi:hypothetical protein
MPRGAGAPLPESTDRLTGVDEPASFSDLPRAVQVQLAGIGPLLLGAVVGFMLGVSEAGFWILTALSVVGGVAGGLDHAELRAATARGLVAGCLFGVGTVVAHEIAGDAALATVPSPIALLVAIDATAGAILSTLGGLLRARTR